MFRLPSHLRGRSAALILAAGVALGNALATAGAPAALAATGSQAVSLIVGPDGRVYSAAFGATPTAVSAAVGPAGAGIAAVREPDGNQAVFTVGSDGALDFAATHTTSSLSFVRQGSAGVASPGTSVSALTISNGVTEVFFAGHTGGLYDTVYPSGQITGNGIPRSVGASGAPADAAVTALPLAAAQAAVYVGRDGALHVTWSNGSTTTWGDRLASPSGLAWPGSDVAATVDADGVTNVFFAGTDQSLWEVRFTAGPQPEPWTPVEIAPAGTTPAGGGALTALSPAAGQNLVLFAGDDRAVHIVADPAGTWLTPYALTAAGVAPAGTSISAVVNGDDIDGNWCGTGWWLYHLPKVHGSGPQPWTGPATSLPMNGLTLQNYFTVASALFH